MIVTPTTLEALFQGYTFAYNEGFQGARSHAFDVAMKISSSSGQNVYPWLGAFPQMREWIGDRVLNSLELHDFIIKNRKFESTVSVKREQMEDDTYGVFKPLFSQMGRTTRLHPDKLIFDLLQKGISTPCYDGKNFFDMYHPSVDEDGAEATSTNLLLDTNNPLGFWYLFDTTQGFKPLIFQERIPYTFQTLTNDYNERVFLLDEYVYGVRARVNAGFGLWQLAFASNAPLDGISYGYARQNMMRLRGDRGHILGITPNLLVVGPGNEAAARRLLKATSIVPADLTSPSQPAYPESNVWHESAELIVTPFL